MSRLAKKPIPLPEGVEMKKDGDKLVFSGAKGALSLAVLPEVKVEKIDGAIKVGGEDSRLVGLFASLVKNAVRGVSEGFKKELELVGVGYKAVKEGNVLKLWLGFSHPIEYSVPEGIVVTVDKGTRIMIEGLDKQQVGQVAAEIRRFRPPEPYKGKGVRYVGEVVRRKAGKAAKAGFGVKG